MVITATKADIDIVATDDHHDTGNVDRPALDVGATRMGEGNAAGLRLILVTSR